MSMRTKTYFDLSVIRGSDRTFCGSYSTHEELMIAIGERITGHDFRPGPDGRQMPATVEVATRTTYV